jgi:allantoate deiminase
MLFVRCKGGISHHPDESVKTSDVAHAIAVLAEAVRTIGARYSSPGARVAGPGV